NRKNSESDLTKDLIGGVRDADLPQRSLRGVAATKKFNRDGQDMQDKKRQLHHEAHEVKPGSAGRLTGFIFSPLNTLKNTEKYKYTSP
ncbi:MAG: hypothetical protein WCI51_20660, partial [Lentisphaerota bacterium]